MNTTPGPRGFLKDDEILAAIKSGDIDIDPPPELGVDAFRVDAAIQPASLDLTIGDIYVPQKDMDDVLTAQTGYELPAGHTAVILSKQRIKLCGSLGAFGFPPAEISSRGILMTNPGHIDPGFNGHLRFTVINMGRKAFTLRDGEPIVTLLLFRLSGNAHRDYAARRSQPSRPLEPADLVHHLSKDFVDFEKRAEGVARSIARDTEYKFRLWGIGVPVLVAIIGILGSWSSGLLDFAKNDDLQALKEKVLELHSAAELHSLQERIDTLEKAIAAPEQGQD